MQTTQDGIALHLAGRLDEAERVFRSALQRSIYDHAAAAHLGQILAARGDPQGLDLIAQAMRLAPNDGTYRRILGEALFNSRRTAEAADALRVAVQLSPHDPHAHFALGKALLAAGDKPNAAAAFARAFDLDTSMVEAAYQSALAKGAFQKPSEEAHFCHGVAVKFRQVDDFDNAIFWYRRALAADPDDALFHRNLGYLLLAAGDYDNARTHFDRATTLQPTMPPLLGYHYFDTMTPEELFARHAAYGNAVGPAAFTGQRDPSPARRLRIGYVSQQFAADSVIAHFLLPILRGHHREQFEIFCYSNAEPSARTQDVQALADHWREIRSLDDPAAATIIDTDAIDILVDLTGHTAEHRLGLFARKPAPIQVTYLGHPNTTGLPAIDYRLTDSIADPPGQTDAWHTEKLIRLPHGFLCYDPGQFPDVTPLPALAHRNAVTFLSIANLEKISPTALTLWARVLQSVPNSRLIIKRRGLRSNQSATARIRRYFAAMHIDPTRLDLLPHDESLQVHRKTLAQADISLDTFPYNGTTTTCETLWMGLPCVTLMGHSHVSRVGASILTNAGLAEFIARDADDYVHIAASLAGDLPRLAELRATMRQRLLQSPLLNAVTFIQDLESAYRQMWIEWTRAPRPTPN